ncbi:MAG: TM2 domain-containing protein [Flexilinea sp.]|nr:TM2 domain-containing protein [Flexilinea sp.]
MVQELNGPLVAPGVLIVWGVTLLIFLVFLIILVKRLSDSISASTQNNGRINQYLAAVPADKIGTVNAVYQNTRKSLGLAMTLSIVGGVFGIQRAYLGKRKSAVLMMLFFWTTIPGIISLFDLTAMPKTVSEFNLSVARSLYDQIASPKIDN